MSIRDRLGENATHQRADPATSTIGRVTNIVGVVLFGSMVVLGRRRAGRDRAERPTPP